VDVSVILEERTKDQCEDDATQFVREYRVGVEVVVRVLHVNADNRAIGPVRGRVYEHDAAPTAVEGFGGAAEARKWASCGREGTVGIDQWGSRPREVTDHLQVLQDVVGREMGPGGRAIERAENLFGAIGMGLAKEDFDRVGAQLVAEFVEWVLRGRAL
jgi:hypothetical protein